MGNSFSEIVERIKKLQGFRTDGEVAEALEMGKTALSSHKTRGTIPYKALFKFCQKESIFFEWLLTGEGELYEINQLPPPDLSPELQLIIEQCRRILKYGSEQDKGKLKGFLAALDPGVKAAPGG